MLDADDFMESLTRVANGVTALDPAVVAKLLGAPRRAEQLGVLTYLGASAPGD
ncbi:hypothetical protein Acy02nite_70230 [Actinoplanes cyaneus]|uniref:Uncharacterized protein n=1 Tax=Actinoplanes cyaneus TaxID=52696 RepID=A0A919M7U4_9ACTN|nr:hypothetical protein [Actinoplanes cyaneus]MCW2140889.1 hypothetical protein [Actinoplanes cyaneus]GID69142.1 hypothetical protein Acy02nite_70230 [Actinoplanes cyaneus]